VSDLEDMNNGRARGWLKSDRPDYPSPQDARWEVFDRRLDATAGVQFFYDSRLQCTVSQVDAPALFKHARNRKTKKARLMKQSVLLEGHTAGYAGLMGVCVRACLRGGRVGGRGGGGGGGVRARACVACACLCCVCSVRVPVLRVQCARACVASCVRSVVVPSSLHHFPRDLFIAGWLLVWCCKSALDACGCCASNQS
jgi:hypothetical protein